MRIRRIAVLFGLLALAACSSSGIGSAPATTAPATTAGASASATTVGSSLPHPAHIVVVVLENHAYSEVVGSASAPYISGLAAHGASFARSFAVAHPSEPNYLALFSGSTQGLTDDSCPHRFPGANLGQELMGARRSFVGYSEGMPADGYPGCASGLYARKHNPWVNFASVPASSNLTLRHFPTDYSMLPTVSFVIPNLCDDMHNCPVSTGDTWLRSHLDGYARWAQTHASLLVLTWDEDDNSHSNQIPTVIVGAHVKTGTVTERITHYSVLRTIEDMYDLPHAGASATAAPIADIWN